MEENKRNAGRPPISGKTKSIRFGIRLNEKEHQELSETAKKNGMSIAEYIRYLIEKDKLKK